MNELIKVNYESGKGLVSARELHEFLEIGTPYSKWFIRMCEYGFDESIDYIVTDIFVPNSKGGKQNQVDHAITIDMAKEISMIQRTEKGKQARQYFLSCEKKLKEVLIQPSLPHDYLSALKALVESEEQKALMQPKVKYYDEVLQPSKKYKMVTVTEIAKDLGMTARALNEKLRELGIQYKQGDSWHLYKKYQNNVPKYADYDITEYGQTLKWSEAGREWLIDMLNQEKIS